VSNYSKLNYNFDIDKLQEESNNLFETLCP